ncbi:MAG: N-acetylglucosamine-6-phosphate deacetylase [Acidobacteria bacterium]|nr:N-acetylglucosamine-6-phosphate deacetylase [Acidobacteriota bacterium]
MRHLLRGRAFIGGRFHDACVVHVAEGKVTRVDIDVPEAGDPEELIVPGFVDMHVHGGAGADFMDGTPEAAIAVAELHARHGTTALAATTISASREAITRSVVAVDEARRRDVGGCAEIVAIHLEGPYLSPSRSGAHPIEELRLPDEGELGEWLASGAPPLWLMTIAPEVAGAHSLVESFRGRVSFSAGHTEAKFTEMLEAIEAGVRHATHLMNAMTPFGQREPGVLGVLAVSEGTTAEVVADGVHLHPVTLQICARLLGDRLALVTDANRAAGAHDGCYELGGQTIVVESGVARTADGALAGSTLTMDRAVRNMVELAGVHLERVVPMATELPARLLGVADRKGRIEEGFDADIVVMSPRLEVVRVLARGHEVE